MAERSKEWHDENLRLAKEHGCKVNQGGTWTDLTTYWPIPQFVTDTLVDKSLALREARKTIYKRCIQIARMNVTEFEEQFPNLDYRAESTDELIALAIEQDEKEVEERG